VKGEEGNDFAPGPPPALADCWIFLPPYAGFEGRQGGFTVGDVHGAIDGLERRRYSFAILVGDEVEAVTQKMDDAGLDRRRWKDGEDRLRKALQAVDDGDENVLDATVFQLVHDT